MLLEGLNWFWVRFRPREGWLSFFLLLAVVIVLAAAVLDVAWVPEQRVVAAAAPLGLLLGAVLAKRPIPAWLGWLLIALYGLLIAVLTVADLWPPVRLLAGDWAALRLYWLENGARFYERGASWAAAVFAGGRSNETVPFAMGMGLIAWFLSAYLGWSAYRGRQPLLALTLMGLIIALNGYYGRAPLAWAAAFIGLAVVATAVFHFADLEQGWASRGVDYATQLRIDLILYAAGTGIALLAFSLLVPTVRANRLAGLLVGSERVAALEESLDRAFGGVDVARERLPAPGTPGGSGVLPRAFLLGDAPQLERIVMMTAEVALIDGPPGADAALARHWRALTYAAYTGRGWALAPTRAEAFRAGEALPLPYAKSQMYLRQRVQWRYDRRSVRYALGDALRLDHAATAYWVDRVDLARVSGGEIAYEIVSRHSAAGAEELRAVTRAGVPPAISRRYTQLPETLPERVGELAQRTAGDAGTPYDQALALERFLRQYPYSLEVPLPPADVDVVDYFLFDLQAGYCDYYASAMVVMARSLGLPARFASGFLAQEADEEGVQTVRQIDGHSWAEIYFAGYGWVAFEPTAAFSSPQAARSGEEGDQAVTALPEAEEAAAIPERDPAPRGDAGRWAALALLGGGATLLYLLIRRQRALRGLDDIQQAYSRLRANAGRLGREPAAGETPFEFEGRLQEELAQLARGKGAAGPAAAIKGPAAELTALFAEHQYSEHPPEKGQEAQRLWRRMRRPFWRLRLRKMVGLEGAGEKKEASGELQDRYQ